MGKGSTQTTNSTQNQSWTPNAQAMSAYSGLLDKIGQVGNTPYQGYTGQRVADFSGDQQGAFQGVRDLQGGYQPYLDAAAGATAGAMTPSYQMAQQYMSPYTQNVVDATRANMNQNNAIAQQGVVGNAALKGALGGDRVGVAQAELARNQSMSDNSTIANLYNQGYQQSINNAQTDANRSLQGANLFNQIGTSAQNLGLQGASALYGMGSAQQQNAQQNLDVPYQNFLEQRAYPYQQLQYLSGLTTGVGSQMGGSGYSTGQSTTETPGNLGKDLIGAGMTAAALFAHGGRVGLADGGMPYAGGGVYIPTVAMSAKPFAAPQFASMGGGGQKPQQGGTNASDLVGQAIGLAGKIKGAMGQPTSLAAPGVAQATPMQVGDTAPSLAAYNAPVGAGVGSAGYVYARGGTVPWHPRGIYVPKHLAEGGDPQGVGGAFGGLGYQPMGWEDYNPPPAPPPVASGVAAADGPPPAVQAINDAAPLPDAAPDDGSQALALAAAKPRTGLAAPQPAPPPPDLSGQNPSELNPNAGQGVAAAPPIAAQDPQVANSILGKIFGLSPEANQALLATGLGMMASHSQNLGVAIGEGGLQGMKVYAEAGKLKEAAERAREQLQERRENHQDTLAERAYTNDMETKRREDDRAARSEAQKRHDEMMERVYGNKNDTQRYGIDKAGERNEKNNETKKDIVGKTIESKEKIAGQNNETKSTIADKNNETRRDVVGQTNESRENIAKGRNETNRYRTDTDADTKRQGQGIRAKTEQDKIDQRDRHDDKRAQAPGRGGSGPADVATAKWLLDNKIAPDEATAWKMARESKSSPQAIESRVYTGALKANFGNTKRAEEAVANWRKMQEQSSPAPAPAAPAKPTASATQPADDSKPAEKPAEGKLKPMPDTVRAQALEALKKKDRAAVIKRLQENGFDPAGL